MKAQTLRTIRRFHHYIAVFFAPAILFFAFTGGLQTAGLHERHGDTVPPRWIVAIANLHKHQMLAGHRHAGPGDGKPRDIAKPGAPASSAGEEAEHFIPVKPFVLLLAIALFVTTALGLVIAVATPSTRRISLLLVVAGILVPLLLMI